MTSTEKTIRIADITAKTIKEAIDRQGTRPTPNPGYGYAAWVVVTEATEADECFWQEDYQEDFRDEDILESPEVQKWLFEAYPSDQVKEYLKYELEDKKLDIEPEPWYDDFIDGDDFAEVIESSALYMSGLEEIVDDIKKDFAPDAIVTIE